MSASISGDKVDSLVEQAVFSVDESVIIVTHVGKTIEVGCSEKFIGVEIRFWLLELASLEGPTGGKRKFGP